MKLVTDEVQERVLNFLDIIIKDPESYQQEVYEESLQLKELFERKKKKKKRLDIVVEV